MRRLHCCPIYSDLRLKTTLQQYEVTAKVKGAYRAVSALAAFTCGNGHIFFLRQSDLAEDNPPSFFAQRAAE